MPSVKIKSPSGGSVQFHYTVSTPSNESAKSIDKKLPTILFIHPVYIAQEVWQMQFGDILLRRFNLVGLDLRCHGETGGKVPQNYSRVEAADDIAKVIDELKLGPCHLAGLSMGACIGLQMAISYPDKILSLSMISPLPLVEPEDVGAGRQEIYDYWVEGFADPKHINKEALADSMFGALQLGFNSQETSLTRALHTRLVPLAMKNWSPKNFADLHTVSVKFFTDRSPHPPTTLARIRCPVMLVHCKGDIAYPYEYVDELRGVLENAGVDVDVQCVEDAPHFGNVTHGAQINRHIHGFVAKLSPNDLPPMPTKVSSPWEAGLIKAGWRPHEDVDSDDE